MSEILYKKWNKLGYGFSDGSVDEFVDLEKVIIDTCLDCHKEPRLFWGALTWIINHGTFVNVSRLISMINKLEDTSKIGCLFDFALQNNADKKLNGILAHCKKKNKIELLFELPKRFKYMEKIIKADALPRGKKWGYFINEITIKPEAMFTRKHILENNPHLAIRALFGANTKSEIFFALLDTRKKTYIQELVRKIGCSYQPVYKEIKALVENGIVKMETVGNLKFIALQENMLKLLRGLPV